jgi:hypothetical protein
MKKYFFSLILVAVALPGFVFAQDAEKAKRPDNIGVSDFDSFKNTSFDILDESTSLKKDATRIDSEVKNYSATISNITLDKLKTDLKALKGIASSSKALSEKIGELDNQGKELLASAKNVSPRTKSPQATSNTNKSVKGLETSRKNLDEVSTLVQNNTKLIADELKKRGETVEE